ncbi:MAG TPA: DsbA family protein [Allosphingosinicella sp.]|nr:DsbA family protein [Allosphingosinicella sp.]
MTIDDAQARKGLAGWKTAMAAGLLGAVVGGGAVAYASRESVRDYLLENPEILPEAMDRLRDREAARVISANRASIETPFAGAWAGAADGDVVLVEFFDYACGYCRKSNADIERLIQEDPKLKVVWREWPVLGADSEAAARASLAAAQAGRFKPFYDTLFAAGRPTPEALAKARSAAGLTGDLTSAAGDRELERNFQLARNLEATGTPTFVVGDQILQGAVGYETLRDAIKEARARKS